jgi:indole-3-glycerol phosphate synthase
MLDDATVSELLACARELGLFILLEGFDAPDLERIARLTEHADPATVLAGVNCRNLRDLQVDFARFAEIAPALPQHLRCVAESGVSSTADVRAVTELGFRLALVGSALMTAGSPEATLQEFIATGRAAGEAQVSA